MRVTIFSFLVLFTALLSGCSRAPEKFRGRWFLDDDFPNAKPHYVEFQAGSSGVYFDGHFEVPLHWKEVGQTLEVAIGEDASEPAALTDFDAAGRLTLTDSSNGKTMHFRHESTVAFVRPMVGEWEDHAIWLVVHEGGWASLRERGANYPIRLEKKEEGLVWSQRFFSQRIYSKLAFDDSKQVLVIEWPNGEKHELRRKG